MTIKKEDGFLPDGYKEPEGKFMKLVDGENTFRVLSPAVTGYEYWTTENKPVRAKEDWAILPADVKLNEKTGKPTTSKHFWVFVVWNVGVEKVQVLELTQKSIMNSMKAYIGNEKWGDPKGYDFTITRTGSGLDTKYVVMANPHSPAPKAEFDINLEAIFEKDGDMFMSKKAQEEEAKAQAEFDGK